jgi:signal-transduction protein with cAMP-binding, CBS, and nucleotidyltransferase domain
MLRNNIRHIPVSEDGSTVDGMLSLRKVLLYLVEDQRENLAHLEAFLNADSPGG